MEELSIATNLHAVNDMIQTECKDKLLHHIQIGKNKYISCVTFKDEKIIHIREYILDDGKLYVTKKGLIFTLKRLANLIIKIYDIDEQIREFREGVRVKFKIHIGGGVFASIQTGFPFVNLRQYFHPIDQIGEIKPSKGLVLDWNEWCKLKLALDQLKESDQEIRESEPCYKNITHMDSNIVLECKECSPFPTPCEVEFFTTLINL